MRHRIKTHSVRKEHSLFRTGQLNNTYTKLLHSDKSTYFYKTRLDRFDSMDEKVFRVEETEQPNLAFPRNTASSQPVVTGEPRLFLARGAADGFLGKVRLGLPNILLTVSSLALLVVLGLMICPIQTSGVMALEGESGIAEQSLTVPESGVALSIDTTLDKDNTVTEQVTGSGTQYLQVDFTVGANQVDDYKVFVQAESTALTGTTYGDTINSIASTNVTPNNIASKQWGYAVVKKDGTTAANLTYNPIQTGVSTPADTVTVPASGITQPYTLAFAANLDGAKADHYKSNITLSVAAGAEEVTNIGFAGKTYMQEVDKTFCSSSSIPIGTEGRLIDKRDGKVYWVAKLNDGLCWMTQNLGLDLANRTLTPSDSDVLANWSPAVSGSSTSFSGDSDVVYYDPGFYIFANASGDSSLRLVSDPGLFYDVSYGMSELGWVATYEDWFIGVTEYLGSDGKTICSKTAGSKVGNLEAVNIACRMYYYDYFDTTIATSQSHYSQGNFYSHNAATAGTSVAAPTGEATSSICPRGWRLPTGQAISDSSDVGSFGKLLSLYGISTSNIGKLLIPPLYFVYAGKDGTGYIGERGYLWTPTAALSGYPMYAFGLYFSKTEVSSTHYLHDFRRANGASVRCVVR